MRTTLSEAESKALLAEYSVPFPPEVLATDPDTAASGAETIGFPVVLKLCGDNIAHKTERGLVRLSIRDASEARRVAAELFAAATAQDSVTGVLIAPMLHGQREFIIGMNRDEQFGATVMFGVGGVMTEVLDDAAVRLVPIDRTDARNLVRSIDHFDLLDDFRGEPRVDVDSLATILQGLSALAQDRPDVHSVDLNPVMIVDGSPIAVDALVEVEK